MKRIGLFGGTFNPIHRGHEQLARAAQQECSLDEILFIPAAQPPHKNGPEIVSYEHRAEMVRLACNKYHEFSLCTIESRLPYPSYTIDTVYALEREVGDLPVIHFFLIGYDAFLEIKTWKDYNILLSKISFILCPRGDSDYNATISLMAELGYSLCKGVWEHEQLCPVYELQSCPDPVSSTGLRHNNFLYDAGLGEVVSPAVLDYIRQQKLYK